jgi:hypothetical protein
MCLIEPNASRLATGGADIAIVGLRHHWKSAYRLVRWAVGGRTRCLRKLGILGPQGIDPTIV